MVTVTSRKMTPRERTKAPWPFMWWKAAARDGGSLAIAHGPTRGAAERRALVELKEILRATATTRMTTR